MCLAFRPRLRDERMRTVFTTGTGWGELILSPGGAELRLLGGRLDLATLSVEHPHLGTLSGGPAHLTPGGVHRLTSDDTHRKDPR